VFIRHLWGLLSWLKPKKTRRLLSRTAPHITHKGTLPTTAAPWVNRYSVIKIREQPTLNQHLPTLTIKAPPLPSLYEISLTLITLKAM
jgi:hypothetical protein